MWVKSNKKLSLIQLKTASQIKSETAILIKSETASQNKSEMVASEKHWIPDAPMGELLAQRRSTSVNNEVGGDSGT